MEVVLYIQLNIFSLIICVLLFLHHISKKQEVIGRNMFNIILITTCIVVVLDSFSWILENNVFSGSKFLYMLELNLHFMLQILPPLFMLRYCGMEEKNKMSKIFNYIANGLFGCATVFLIINNYDKFIFYITNDNHYVRMWGFYIIGAIPIIIIVLCLILVLRLYVSGNSTDKEKALHYVVFICLVLTGAVMQVLFFGLETIWMMTTIGLIYIYINVQSRREEKVRNELVETGIKVMMSQIQPHFLYNTLTVIYNLCTRNPEEAQKTTAEFANYLRGNLDSLKKSEPISFEMELKHVELYLNLEKRRFLDELNIIYDIEATNFMVPALSIQPLVENAVKYGVGQKEDGGTVCISSKECKDYFEIIVRDDGVGFDIMEPKEDGRTHIGIENVRKRLEMMVQASLDIKSTKGVGTVATIRVPKVMEE